MYIQLWLKFWYRYHDAMATKSIIVSLNHLFSLFLLLYVNNGLNVGLINKEQLCEEETDQAMGKRTEDNWWTGEERQNLENMEKLVRPGNLNNPGKWNERQTN